MFDDDRVCRLTSSSRFRSVIGENILCVHVVFTSNQICLLRGTIVIVGMITALSLNMTLVCRGCWIRCVRLRTVCRYGSSANFICCTSSSMARRCHLCTRETWARIRRRSTLRHMQIVSPCGSCWGVTSKCGLLALSGTATLVLPI
ncbi:unnamed protein product, partial [Ectocarpus sp. 12 AP-2014]